MGQGAWFPYCFDDSGTIRGSETGKEHHASSCTRYHADDRHAWHSARDHTDGSGGEDVMGNRFSLERRRWGEAAQLATTSTGGGVNFLGALRGTTKLRMKV